MSTLIQHLVNHALVYLAGQMTVHLDICAPLAQDCSIYVVDKKYQKQLSHGGKIVGIYLLHSWLTQELHFLEEGMNLEQICRYMMAAIGVSVPLACFPTSSCPLGYSCQLSPKYNQYICCESFRKRLLYSSFLA